MNSVQFIFQKEHQDKFTAKLSHKIVNCCCCCSFMGVSVCHQNKQEQLKESEEPPIGKQPKPEKCKPSKEDEWYFPWKKSRDALTELHGYCCCWNWNAATQAAAVITMNKPAAPNSFTLEYGVSEQSLVLSWIGSTRLNDFVLANNQRRDGQRSFIHVLHSFYS